MKKIIILVLVLWAGFAYADPFLVCDPQPDADGYMWRMDGAATWTTQPYTLMTIKGQSVALVRDLNGITDGAHTIEVKAYNVWGESIIVPFAFNRALPGRSQNVRLGKP